LKHHTVSMRLLLIAVSCLAVSLALPKPEEKKLTLTDDAASYETSHDKNAVTDKRSVGGYFVSSPDVLPDAYGPPGYEPGVPLGNDYLPPVGLVKVSTPVPEVQQTYVKPEVAHTVSSTTLSVPVEETKTVTVAPSSTSYGVPVAGTVKTSVGTAANAHVKSTVKTVKTEIHEEEQNVPQSVVNVVHQAPAVDDVARFASGVKTVPAVTTTVTKNVVGSVPLAGSLPNVYDSYAKDFNVPAVTSQQPYTLTHTVNRVQEPVRTLTVPSVAPVSTLVPLQTLTPLSQVRTVQSVKSVNTPVQQTVHTVQSVPTVEYTKTLTPVQQVQVHTPVQSAPVVKTVETVTPVHTVHTEQSVKTAAAAHPVKSVEILSPPPLQPTESCHTLTKVVKTVPVTGEHVQKGFFDDVGQFLQPFFPFLPQASTGAPIAVTTENPETVFLSSTPLPTAVVKESASVSNPVLVNAQVVSSTVSPLENVQPTHVNGGYLY
ncbi:uncharacterized protein LOC143430676, partial [Xylocopa sonorina]|uniref:uncharacterized protein LOC143430676 n=1 Tax=Xylocopa sonorina TaxID=1818115 RepID=UPI00403B2019